MSQVEATALISSEGLEKIGLFYLFGSYESPDLATFHFPAEIVPFHL